MSSRFTVFSSLCVVLLAQLGCTEVRGRKKIQEANELYKRGRYREAVTAFEAAEALVPNLPTLWLNKGYTCRQLIVPTAAGQTPPPDSRRAADCALAAFQQLRRLDPSYARGEQLYVQTLFDANDFAALEAIFLARAQRPAGAAGVDVDAVAALEQVYFKWGRWAQALFWSRKAAAARAGDAEAQHEAGAFIWQILASHGGGAEMISFDPRPRPPAAGVAPAPAAASPPSAADDITGGLRVELADEAIADVQRALALRPSYPDAMATLALLHRQRALAFFGAPARWQAAVAEADDWQRKAAGARLARGEAPAAAAAVKP